MERIAPHLFAEADFADALTAAALRCLARGVSPPLGGDQATIEVVEDAFARAVSSAGFERRVVFARPVALPRGAVHADGKRCDTTSVANVIDQLTSCPTKVPQPVGILSAGGGRYAAIVVPREARALKIAQSLRECLERHKVAADAVLETRRKAATAAAAAAAAKLTRTTAAPEGKAVDSAASSTRGRTSSRGSAASVRGRGSSGTSRSGGSLRGASNDSRSSSVADAEYDSDGAEVVKKPTLQVQSRTRGLVGAFRSDVSVETRDSIVAIIRKHVAAVSEVVPRANANLLSFFAGCIAGENECPFLSLKKGDAHSVVAKNMTDVFQDALMNGRLSSAGLGGRASADRENRPFAVFMAAHRAAHPQLPATDMPQRLYGDAHVLLCVLTRRAGCQCALAKHSPTPCRPATPPSSVKWPLKCQRTRAPSWARTKQVGCPLKLCGT